MARAKIVHSDDACTMIFRGDRSSPEPSTGIIKFPGGCVEVSRCTDGQYYAHISLDNHEYATDSRIDYEYETKMEILNGKIPPIPYVNKIQHIAVKVNGPYLDYD